MDVRWTFHIPTVDLDAGADRLADDSFEFAVVMAPDDCRERGPASLTCGSGPADKSPLSGISSNNRL